jgi:hypothetical protein
MSRAMLLLIMGFIGGVISYYHMGEPRQITVVEQIIKEVPKIQVVEKEIIKRIEVPKIIVREVIKEIKVPSSTVTIVKTRTIYVPNKDVVKVDKKELECMSLNIYREANNQSTAGMVAVARVVMNRVMDRRYPGDPCGVIYDAPMRESWKTKKNSKLKEEERIYYPARNRCQFSWYCDGKADEVIKKENNIKWKIAEDIAYNVLAYDKWNGILEGATHYHADYVKPKWRHSLQLIAKIDDHIFYRSQ